MQLSLTRQSNDAGSWDASSQDLIKQTITIKAKRNYWRTMRPNVRIMLNIKAQRNTCKKTDTNSHTHGSPQSYRFHSRDRTMVNHDCTELVYSSLQSSERGMYRQFRKNNLCVRWAANVAAAQRRQPLRSKWVDIDHARNVSVITQGQYV